VKPYLTLPTTEASASPAVEIVTDAIGTSTGNTTEGEDIANEDTIVVQLYEPDNRPTQLVNPTQLVKCSRGRPCKYPPATDFANITVFLQDKY
jgi:hypothetical protein